MKKVKVIAPDDGGNIVELVEAKSNTITLHIRQDYGSKWAFHWFYFQLNGQKGQTYNLRILNAKESGFSPWEEPGHDFPYAAVASYDGEKWFRVETQFNGKELFITTTLQQETIYFATFAPYPYARHQKFLSSLNEHKLVSTIGQSAEGRPISLVTIGAPSEKALKCWIIARQHPGEPMAEWFMEGLIPALQKQSMENVVFYLVPNMNPDGTFHGNLRTNARGYDLNRSWPAPDEKNTPEVFHVLKAMDKTGVDFFLDVHGDEQIPYVFLETGVNNKSLTLGRKFINHYEKANKHVQSKVSYYEPGGKLPSGELLKTAHCTISQKFDCVSLLLEMPYKDDKNHPNKEQGWSPEASKNLGESLIQPLKAILPEIRNQNSTSVSNSKQNVFSQNRQPPTGTDDPTCFCNIL